MTAVQNKTDRTNLYFFDQYNPELRLPVLE
ncbi:hypothetical protein DSUL_20395 [Desulfovibrionales bacterium]